MSGKSGRGAGRSGSALLLGIVVAGAAAAHATTAWAQAGNAPATAKIVEPPAPLLPTTETLVAPAAGLDAPADTPEQQTILKEDGLQRAEARVRVAAAGQTAATGWVKAYQFSDATGALAAYTFLRQGGRAIPRPGQQGVSETEMPDGEIVLLEGISVARFGAAQRGAPLADLVSRVETGLPKPSGRRSLPPLLPSIFPAEVSGARVDLASLRYAVGPAGYQAMGGELPPEILGWDKSAEVATANYTGRNGMRGQLTLFSFPTPQIAGDRGRAIEKAVNDAGGSGGNARFGTVAMRRIGPLVAMTTGAMPKTTAQNLVEAVHLNEEVTFDKPMGMVFHAEVRKTATLLQEIAIFTGVLMIAAIVIAIFLGGTRAAVRVLRGKSAASDPEFLTINLRESPHGFFAPPVSEGGGAVGSDGASAPDEVQRRS